MGVGRGKERPGTLAYMTRKGQEEDERVLLPFLLLVVVTASTKFVLRCPRPVSSPSAYTDRKREARRISPPRFGARTRNLFAAEAGRVCRHAHLRPSFRILSLPSSFTGCNTICGLSLADLSADFCFPASILSPRTFLNPLPFSSSPHRSINGYLNAPVYRSYLPWNAQSR